MRVVETNVFQYDELDDRAKERAREWYSRHVFEDSCDWEFVYEDAVRVAEILGIEISTSPVRLMSGKSRQKTDIYFSGFWSQGDGAAFEGHVASWAPVLLHLEKPQWLKWAIEENWSFYSYTRRSNNMQFGNHMPGPANPYDEEDEPLQYDAWIIRHQPPSDHELEQLESDLQSLFNDLADDLYRQLEEEYEHLTSDDTTLEYILGNIKIHELDLDEDEIEAVQEARDNTSPIDERQLALF